MTDHYGMATTYATDPATLGPWSPRLDECSVCERSSSDVHECASCGELVCDECAEAGPMERDTGYSETFCDPECGVTYPDDDDDSYYY